MALLVIAVGAFAFISVPRIYYFLICVICFGPCAFLAIYRTWYHIGPDVIWTNVCNVICIIVIFAHSNRNSAMFQQKEYQARQSLNNMLKERDAEINQLVNEISVLRLGQAEFNKKEETFKLARQVAHDIRAPLSALNLATKKLGAASSEINELIGASSKRINDIAETMLKKSKADYLTQNMLYADDINVTVRKIVEEKKLTAHQKLSGKLARFTIHAAEATLRARFFESDFSRALSNLIENSLDAVSAAGREAEIDVTCERVGDAIVVTVRDNGLGIPPEIIANVGRYGFTYGKVEGSGLGMAYAVNLARAAGGQIEIESEPDKFTKVKMTLPVLKGEV